MFIRNCPKCGKEIKYKSEITKNNADKYNRICFSCNGKKNGWSKINKEVTDGIRINSFKDKRHTDESKKKMSLKHLENSDVYKTLEFRQKMSNVTSGEKNGMFGKSFYDIWIEKYGKEIADKKYNEWREKISNNTRGENNPMYGKPTPTGSGNGWSGWYKGWYFRSLH